MPIRHELGDLLLVFPFHAVREVFPMSAENRFGFHSDGDAIRTKLFMRFPFSEFKRFVTNHSDGKLKISASCV